jgi:ribosomal protein L15
MNKVKKVDIFEIQLKTLVQKCPDNFDVTLESLKKIKILPKRINKFKIIGNTVIVDKKLFLKNCKVSAGVKASVEKAGGKVEFSK